MTAFTKQEMCEVLVSVAALSDRGLRREINEDSFLIADLTTGDNGLGLDASTCKVGRRGLLMAVSDGMGGAAAGEIASRLAVTELYEMLMCISFNRDAAARLKMATRLANWRIHSHAEQHPELKGMGATLTAVLVEGTVAYVAQIGGSRAYLIRGRQIKQLTKDQTLVQLFLDAGVITPEQARSVRNNMLAQSLGTEPGVEVALTSVELCRGDFLLVSSDGLSNKVSPQEIKQVVGEEPSPSAACRRLIEMANGRGGEDDTTVILARLDGAALACADRSITEGLEIIDRFAGFS